MRVPTDKSQLVHLYINVGSKFDVVRGDRREKCVLDLSLCVFHSAVNPATQVTSLTRLYQSHKICVYALIHYKCHNPL